MTNTIRDITTQAQVIMLVGSNPEEAHPVIGMQIRQAVERGAKLIVVDPRDIWLSEKADVHLKLRPGTNVAFANGFVRELIHAGLVDKEYVDKNVEGFEGLKKMVESYTPERVAEICHIDPRDFVQAARMYGQADRAAIMYCLGVTEHSTGTQGVMSLSNIALVSGKIGRPGCGINPIRGQNNVQGASDMAAAPDDFPGYQKVWTPGVFEKFEKAWGTTLTRTRGVKATDCFPQMIEGKIKGLYLFGEDPVRTDADTHHVIKGLKSLDFLVVQELFMTETAKYADVILPGVSYTEKDGTFTNTERRVQRVRKAIEPRPGTRPDTWTFTEVMNRMGYPQPHLSPKELFDEIASVLPQYGGISYERLASPEVGERGLQWPCPSADAPDTPIMWAGGFPRGKASFSLAEYKPSAEMPDEEYPLMLTTGRILAHYNACAMTSRTEGIEEIANSSFIEINSEDAARIGIADGDRVRVSSRRGSIDSWARVSGKTFPGETWMPLHFQDGNCNWLTNAALDSTTKTPEFKVCAVRVEKAAV